jgi:hypothetical protein
MSIDPWEAQQEAAYERFVDQLAQELYQEHRERAIDEFVSGRLKSYYEEHSDLAIGAIRFLRNAKELVEAQPTASLLLSSAATEVILKSVLLKPIVVGLVHTESLAELVANMLVRQTGIDRFRELVFKILEHHVEFNGGVENYKRKGSEKPLWQERKRIQDVRNVVFHRAEFCASEDAKLSLEVGRTFLGLTTLLIKNVGCTMDAEGRISG